MVDPELHRERTTDSGARAVLPRRYRIPDRLASVVVLLLAVVAAALGGGGTVVGVLALKNAQRIADDAIAAQRASVLTRRANQYASCRREEAQKRDMRVVLRAFGVDPHDLPDPDGDGRPVFAPIDGGVERGCRAYTRRTVPDSNLPKK